MSQDKAHWYWNVALSHPLALALSVQQPDLDNNADPDIHMGGGSSVAAIPQAQVR